MRQRLYLTIILCWKIKQKAKQEMRLEFKNVKKSCKPLLTGKTSNVFIKSRMFLAMKILRISQYLRVVLVTNKWATTMPKKCQRNSKRKKENLSARKMERISSLVYSKGLRTLFRMNHMRKVLLHVRNPSDINSQMRGTTNLKISWKDIWIKTQLTLTWLIGEKLFWGTSRLSTTTRSSIPMTLLSSNRLSMILRSSSLKKNCSKLSIKENNLCCLLPLRLSTSYKELEVKKQPLMYRSMKIHIQS